MPPANEFGALLKKLRESRHLTQEELAKVVCVTPVAVQNYESGRRYPKRPVMALIAQTLGVREFYLLMTAEERAQWDSRASGQSAGLGLSEFLEALTVNELEGLLALKKALAALTGPLRKKGT